MRATRRQIARRQAVRLPGATGGYRALPGGYRARTEGMALTSETYVAANDHMFTNYNAPNLARTHSPVCEV